LLQASGDRRRIENVHDHASLGHDFRYRTAIASDDGRAAGKRFKRGHAEALVEAHQRDARGAAVQRGQVVVGHVGKTPHAVMQAGLGDGALDGFGADGGHATQDELRVAREVRSGEGAHQARQVLAWLDRAEVQHVSQPQPMLAPNPGDFGLRGGLEALVDGRVRHGDAAGVGAVEPHDVALAGFGDGQQCAGNADVAACRPFDIQPLQDAVRAGKEAVPDVVHHDHAARRGDHGQHVTRHEEHIWLSAEHLGAEPQLCPQPWHANDPLGHLVSAWQEPVGKRLIHVQAVRVALILLEQVPQDVQGVVLGARALATGNSTGVHSDEHWLRDTIAGDVPVQLKVLDLSQNWDTNTPGFARYDGPSIKWVKRVAFEGVGGMEITSTLHVGTHLDAPNHFITNARGIGELPIEFLVGPACVVDLQKMGLGDYQIYGPEHFERWEQQTGIKIERGDILVIHTGYHRFYPANWTASCGPIEPDETRYFIKHPGPTRQFADWVKARGIRWLAIDAGSADHPMNTVIRQVRPDLAKKCSAALGRPLEEIWPDDDIQVMHYDLFPHEIIHIENAGGEIDRILDQRVTVGCFPWRFIGGEAAFCRFVAFV